jgi:hypothetical protein
MSQSDEDSKPSKPEPAPGAMRRLGAPVAAVLACLAAVGGYHLFYARKNYAYLIDRDHRFLATRSRQIGEAIAGEGRMLQALDQLKGEIHGDLGEALRKLKEQYEVTLDDAATCPDPAAGGAAGAGRAGAASATFVGIVPAPEGYGLRLRYGGLCASVQLGKLLGPLLASRKAFSAVLLVDERGKVIYQPPELNLPRLDPLLSATGVPPARGDAKARPETTESAGEGAPAALRALHGAGREQEVEIRGRKYKLFSQPFTLPVAAASVGAQHAVHEHEEGPQDWLVCGLIASDELLYDSIALSPPVLGAAVAVLLLALLGWPLCKLKLLGERRRMRLGDVIMVAVGSLLGVSWLTLSLLGLRQHWQLGRLGDAQLESFAARMAENLEDEIRRGYAQLEALECAATADPKTAAATPDRPYLRPELLAQKPALLASYPFADSFVLIAPDGRGALRWTTDRVALAPRPAQARDYFQRALRGNLWQLPRARAARPAGSASATASGGRTSAGPGVCSAAPALAGGFPPGPGGRARGAFVLESVTSLISNRRQAVLAKPAALGSPDRFAVATLALPMLSVIRPVLPPDVEFAVVDRDGAVLFHSDPERNKVENLFDETNQDLHLMSAVRARGAATLDLRYWGESYRARVVPVHGPPWAVVALRDEGPLAAANVEAILVALVFLLLYAGAFGLGLLALALLRPGYRPEWLWPSPERSNDYVRLLLLYLLLCLVFVVTMALVPGSDHLVGAACLLVSLAIFLGYLQLTRHDWRLPAKAAWTAGLVSLCLALALLLAPWEASGLRPHGLASWSPSAITLPLVLAAVFLVLWKPTWWRRWTRRKRVAVAWAHPALGVLLLLLLSVLPVVAIWKTAVALSMDCFVKRGQLMLADALAARRDRAERLYAERWGSGKSGLLALRYGLADAAAPLAPTAPPAALAPQSSDAPLGEGSGRQSLWDLDFYGDAFFSTRIENPEREDGADPRRGTSGQAGGNKAHGQADALPELLESLLPVYSSYAAESRELLHDRATDRHWDRDGDELSLESETLGHRLVSLPPRSWLAPAFSRSGALSAAAQPDGRAGQPGQAAGGFSAASAVGTAVAGAFFLALLAGLSWFISRRVFLVDLIEPLWSGRIGAVGSNLFLVNRGRDWPPRDPASFVPLHFRDLESQDPGWPDKRMELQRSQPGRTALVEGFEHRIFDPEFNDKKLAFLEDLIQDRTVVVLSAVSPDMLLARPAAAVVSALSGAPQPVAAVDNRERWRALIAAFTVIDEDVRPRADEASLANVTVFAWKEMKELLRQVRDERTPLPRRDHRFNSPLLARECADNPVLIQFGRELDPFAIGLDRRQLLEELGERAEAYYRSLWATCCDDEKLVVGHLAEDGLINEHDRRWVRRLMARGLIRREPVFRLMNETFRRFVLSPACRREVQELEQCTGESPWDRFRRPFFATVAAGVVFFLATQKQLLDGTLAIAASVTAGLPAVAKVLDLMSGRRIGGAR